VPGADAGTLAFLVGRAKASEESSDTISGHLNTTICYMGSPEKIFYCGGLGAGLAAKISNNYLSGTILLAVAEAMNIGIRSGVDKHVLFQVIHNSTGQSFMCDQVNPVPGVVLHSPSSRDYQGGFKAQMMVKDIQLGVDAAEKTGVRSTLGPAALELYKEAALDPRCIDRDVSVVYRFLDGPE
jgi:3-hydroxyisobutyrate dehydrogenase